MFVIRIFLEWEFCGDRERGRIVLLGGAKIIIIFKLKYRKNKEYDAGGCEW